jgi:hypothetical protein
MKRAFLLSMIALVLVGTTTNIFADNRRYRDYSEREIRELGARNGYQIGLRAGFADARDGYKLDYKRNPDYKFGMVGYRGEYRHDGNYKNGFRKGFESGYREAYNRAYNNRGGGWGWGNGDRNRDRNNDRYDDRDYRRDDRPYNRY